MNYMILNTIYTEKYIGRILENKLKEIGISLDVMEQKEKITYEYEHALDNLDFDDYSKIDPNKIQSINTIYYSTHTNGHTKILTFDDKEIFNKIDESEEETPELIVNIELGGLGISLIHDTYCGSELIRNEISFLNLHLIE
jgi:frataxin-like iron-binding protein CyaY